MKNENENENGTVLIPKEIHTVAARAAPGDLDLKSHPKDYQQKLKASYNSKLDYKFRSNYCYKDSPRNFSMIFWRTNRLQIR